MAATTKQFKKRNAILECLRSTTAHPSAEMVHEMLHEEHPDISLATIYRNLALFKNRGEIISVCTVSGVERFDANTTPHVHFICEACDSVTDMHDIHIPESLSHDVTEKYGHRMHTCRAITIGLCKNCLENTNT